jgi:hypothetical protein
VQHGFTTPTWRGDPEGMLVTKGPPLAKPRKLYRFTGLGTHLRYGVHDHSLGNVRRGLVERVFMVERNGTLIPTPKPIPGLLKSSLSRFRKSLRPWLVPITRLSTQEFLGFYTGHKLARYQEAAESLEVCPLERKDGYLSTFVKAEKICITTKPDPAPRVIQPRSPRFNVELGRYLRHGEKYLFTAIDRLFGGRTVFKGINADEAGVEFEQIWNSFRKPVAIGMDASRFDQHCSREALEFEHSIWLDMYPYAQRKGLKALLDQQITNRGIARCPDGVIRYKVEGCRMSGDMNTSSGNCLLMCSMIWEWCRSRGIAKYRLANNGDDCVVFMEQSDELRFMEGCKEYFAGLGFTMKIEDPVYTLEHAEFCQTRPIKVGGEYRMIRNLHQSMSKDLHCIHDLAGHNVAEAWVSAIGAGGRSTNEGVPVLQEFFHHFPRSEVKLKGELLNKFIGDQMYKFNAHRSGLKIPIEAETRYSFWLAFGLTADEQIALERNMGMVRVELSEEDDFEEQPSLLSHSRA